MGEVGETNLWKTKGRSRRETPESYRAREFVAGRSAAACVGGGESSTKIELRHRIPGLGRKGRGSKLFPFMYAFEAIGGMGNAFCVAVAFGLRRTRTRTLSKRFSIGYSLPAVENGEESVRKGVFLPQRRY